MGNLRQIVLVLGMHRSGTSALAALVSRLGFNLGENLLPANEFNAKGYYENEGIVKFHTDALEYLGSSWHDLRILPDKLFRERWLDDVVLKLASIIQMEFGAARRIVVKDPRACRLLPIWQRVAAEKGVDLRFILIGRHPLEVCYSLGRRDGFSRSKSLLLWLQYNLAAERHTRSYPRMILRYGDLLAEPKLTAKALATFLKVKAGRRVNEAGAAVDSSLAHHQVKSQLFCDYPDINRWTKGVWTSLFQQKAVKVSAQKRLDAIFKELAAGLAIFPEEAIGRGDEEAAAVRRQLTRTEQEHQALKERYTQQNQSLKNVMAQRGELRKKFDKAKAEADRLVREASVFSATEKIHAELLQTERERAAEAQRQLVKLELQCENFERDVKRLHRFETNLKHELFQSRAELSAASEKIEALLATKATLERELLELQKKDRTANEKIETLLATEATLETDILQHQKHHRTAIERIDDLLTAKAELERELSERSDRFRAQLEAAQREEAKLQSSLKSRRQEVDAARMQTKRAEAFAQASEEQTNFLDKALEKTAMQLVNRHATIEGLRRELETLRRHWTALPLRRRLKRLAASPLRGESEVARLNAITPSVWNPSVEGFKFGLSVFPDVRSPEMFSIEGWVLPNATKEVTTRIRLVSESGSKYEAELGRSRIDIPLLFPDNAKAAYSGFAVVGLANVSGEIWRLEMRKSSGESVPLAFIDFCAIGWQHLRDIREVVISRLFDTNWYATHYGLLDLDRLALISHYLREGAPRGLFPNPLFDTTYYLDTNKDVCLTGENPLLSYWRAAQQGTRRQPNRWFDPVLYLTANKDVARAGLDPFLHYLDYGRVERRNPGPRFDIGGYLELYPDVAQHGNIDALSHFIHYGEAEGRQVVDPQAVKWVYRRDAPSDGKLNILLVGHVLGQSLFGAERSLLELIQLVDRHRFNLFCSFPTINRSFIERIKPFVAGVAVFPYQWWDAAAPESDGFVGQFEEILRSCEIGLVHVNSLMLRDPLVAAQRVGIPSILHVREVVALDRALAEHIGLPAEQIVEKVVTHSDFIVANSHFTQAQYKNEGRSFVLYNTANEVAYDMPLRRRERELRVAMISSNVPKKGLEDFVAVARLALKDNLPLEFWLIGPGTDWLRQRFRVKEDCPVNVRLIDYVENPFDVLREVDVVVNLSHFAESFGRTIAEGMLARRPAVVYNYGALPELVRDGVDGFVVPFKDVTAVVQRLKVLADDPSLLGQMAETGRVRALCNFSRPVGAKTLNAIYDKVLKRPGVESETPARAAHDAQPAASGQKVRIGYFLWHFPVPSETFVLNELRHFVHSGYDVRVFCCQSPLKDFKPDFPIVWQQVKSPEELALRIQETNREIMHSHFVFPTVTQYLWPACERARVPFTFIAHGQDVFRYASAAENRLDEIARSPFCRRVFAPGTFHRDLFLASGVPEEKIIVNPQTILFQAYEAQPVASRLRQPKMSVCAIHRFVEKKGLPNAIKAATELAPRGISLHLYGYGPLEQSYRDLVAELGLDNVFFAGPVTDREHMTAVFQEHDLFICPSIRADDGDMDGIPTILLEAMASHVPVVASRVSSIPDLIQDGVTGYLCEPGDPGSLAQAILRFYGDSTARVQSIIENARGIVARRFDITKASRTLLRSWSGEGLDVILVTFNATAQLREVIERLYRYTKTPFQLYIVDNGSAQDTLDYLESIAAEHDNIHLLPQGKNLFVGPGFNKGLEAGTAPFAVYLCSREGYILSEGWDQSILNYMEDHPVVGLAGTLGYSPAYLTGGDYIAKLEPFSRFRSPGFAEQNPDRLFRHVQGGMFVIRRSMYEAIGGFSETVPHNHTDVEYSYYVESCGWELGHIPEVLALYSKTRPDLTARLTESVGAVHPGSPALSPLFDAVVGLRSNFCNVCGSPTSFTENEILDRVCPECSATSFHRSLYRFLADSSLTYRRLHSLFAGEFNCLQLKWKEMFGGRATEYSQLLSEMSQQQRLDHPSDQLDVIVLRVPDPVLDFPRALVAECRRILNPMGTFLYFQRYGTHSILGAALDGTGDALRNADCVASQLEGTGFQIDSRVRYASAVVRYSEHVIFACSKSSGQ